MLPGSGEVGVEVWQYNKEDGDVFVGSTFVDMENRYLSTNWRKYIKKPVEMRTLRPRYG